MASRMTKAKITSYMRNVGRSFGYAMTDSIKSMNPTVTALFRSTAEQSRELYQSVKNFDAKSLGFENSDLKGTLGQGLKDLKNNALEDIRTGKWYNKERIARYENEMASDMLGVNLDDFGDFGDFDFDDTDLDEQASITEDATKATVQAMDTVGGKVSTAVSTAAIKSADYIVESGRLNTKALYGLNQAGFSQVNKGMAAVNGNLQLLVSLAEPITTHIQNSALFYTKSQEYQNKSLELLKQIAANTAPKSSNSFGATGKKRKTYADYITSEGVLDFQAILTDGGKRIKENTEMITSMLSIVPGGEKAIIKMATASPLQFALTTVIGGMFSMKDKQGRSIKDSFESFNKVLSNFSLGLLGKMKNYRFGNNILSPFLRGIRDFLLPTEEKIQKKANSGNYEKGKVDWDGISRRALTEVIPKQLGQILSILERNFGPAGDYRVYDYDKGRFTNTKDIRRGYMNDRKRFANQAGGEIFRDVRNSLKYSGMSKGVQKGYNQQIDSLLDYMLITGNYDILSSGFNFGKAGMSPSVAADLQKRIRAISNSKGGQVKLSNLTGSVYGARNSFDTRNRNSSNVENALVDNSIASGRLINMADDYGFTVGDYLREILGHVSYVSKNLKNLVRIPGVGGMNQDGTQIKWEEGDFITKSNNRISHPNSSADKVPMELYQGGNHTYDVEGSVAQALGTETGPRYSAALKDYLKKRKENPNYPVNEELEDEKQRADELYNAGNKIKGFGSSAYGKLKAGKFGGALTTIEENMKVSTEEVSNALDELGGALNDFVFDKDKGLYALMNTMTFGIMDMVKGLIPPDVRNLLKAGWNKFKTSDFGQATFRTLKNIGLSFFGGDKKNNQYRGMESRQVVTDLMSEIDDPNGPFLDELTGREFASGTRRVKKTGIVTVSKGEMIIPSNLNPFYKGIHSRTQQMKDEQRARANFWGNFARGTFSAGATGIEPEIAEAAMSSGRESETPSSNKDDGVGETEDVPPDQAKGALRSVLSAAGKYLGGKLFTTVSKVMGKSEDDQKKVQGSVEKLMKEAGLGKGAIGAGAILGAGTSLIAGTFLGPIAGAAIGAAAGFVSQSETAQKFLFGDLVDDGQGGKERTGGLLNKELSNFFQKNAKGTAKGAGAGMLIGSFMGSPVLGAILGATAGYISSSKSAKEAIFGEFDEDGNVKKEGIIPSGLQKAIKQRIPFLATGIGAALLMAHGPLIPKLAIGATIGMVAGADGGKGLKEWFFGDGKIDKKTGKENKGFLGYINDKLFQPIIGTIDKAFNILTKSLKDKLTQLVRGFGNFIKDRLSKSTLGRGILNVGQTVGKALGNVAHAPVWLAGLPFRAADTALESLALRQGAEYRNLETNQYLTSAERLARYKDEIPEGATPKKAAAIREANKGKFRYRETGTTLVDQYLAGLNPEDYNTALADLQAAEASGDYSGANNATIKAILANSKHGLDQLRYKDITHGINQAKIDQEARTRAADEKAAKESTPEFAITEKIPTLIERIADTADKISNYLTGNIGDVKLDGTPEDAALDENGNPLNSSNTGREILKKEEEQRDANKAMIAQADDEEHIVGALNDVKDAITNEDDEKKESLIDKLKRILLGDDKTAGLLGGVLGFFTGVNPGGIVGKVISAFGTFGSWAKVALPSIITTALVDKIFLDALSGKFDSLFQKFGFGRDRKNQGIDSGTSYTGATAANAEGKQVAIATDEKGNYIKDEDGNYLSTNGEVLDPSTFTSTDSTATSTGSSRMIKNIARGALTGTSSLLTGIANFTAKGISKVAPRTSALVAKYGGKLLDKTLGKGTQAIANLATGRTGQGALTALVVKMGGQIDDVFVALAKVPVLRKLPLDKLASSIKSSVFKNVQGTATKNAANLAKGVLGTAAFALKLVTAAVDFEEGFADAYVTLHVAEPTLMEKIISGVIRVVKNLIPFVGTFIPDSSLVNLIVDTFGWSTAEFKKRREEADEILEAYNESEGTNYTWEEYQKQVKGHYTIGERIGNAIKTITHKSGSKYGGDTATKSGYRNGVYVGTTEEATAGSGSGIISQFDRRYNKFRVGGKSFAANGCGPASAVMAAGGNINDAVRIAQRYQTVGGTDAAYFGEMFNRQGLPANYYMAGGNSLIGDIASGKPTVLMGQDTYNTSKANSPFGPNNHYVVASGFDGSGNLIIADPEQRSLRRYNPNILRNVKIGISGGLSNTAMDISSIQNNSNIGGFNTATTANSTSRVNLGNSLNTLTQAGLNNGKRSYSGSSNSNVLTIPGGYLVKDHNGTTSFRDTSEGYHQKIEAGDQTAAYIFACLVRSGYSDGAACGILANLQAESGMNPAALQKTKSGNSPAAGIAQWERYDRQEGRWLQLKQYADSKGTDWTDLQTQIEFLLGEVEGSQKHYFNKVCGGVENFKKTENPKEATLYFQKAFERGNPEKAHMELRYGYAEEFFRKFSSLSNDQINEILNNYNPSTAGIGSAGAEDSKSSSSGFKTKNGLGILGTIMSAFSQGFAKVFGGTTETEDAEESISQEDTQFSEAKSSSGILGTSGDGSGEVVNGFPYYNQTENPWQSEKYGSKGTIKSSGCGPTSAAMVLKSYGTNVTPSDTAKYSVENGFRVEGQGTGWGFFDSIGKASGLTTQQFSDAATAKANLSNNIPVIASMKPGDFTKGGHYVVLSKLNGNELYVNDPASRSRSAKIWDADYALNQAKQFWAMSKDGVGSIGTDSTAGSGSGLVSYKPSRAGNYILMDNSRNYYKRTGKAGGASNVSTPSRSSGGTLISNVGNMVRNISNNATGKIKDTSTLPTNVSAIKSDTSAIREDIRIIASYVQSMNNKPNSTSSSTPSNTVDDDYLKAFSDLRDVTDSVITAI